MTLTSNWSVGSDDENSRHSFLSECDSDFDLSPSTRYLDEGRSISALQKLSINRHEPLIIRSRVKAIDRAMLEPQPMPKERRRSTIRHSIDLFTDKAVALTNSIFFSKQQSSDNRLPSSPTDGVHSLTNWLQSCSLDEMGTMDRRPDCETTSHCMGQINPFSSSKAVPDSNPFSSTQRMPSLIQSVAACSDQQQTQLWSRFRSTTPTTQDHPHDEPFNSSSSATFIFPFNNNNNNNFSLTVPTLLTNTISTPTTLLTPPQAVLSKSSPHKEGHPTAPPSSKTFFTLIIFAVGLLLGYLLTNTFPPNLILQWLLLLWNRSAQLTAGYVHLFRVYLSLLV